MNNFNKQKQTLSLRQTLNRQVFGPSMMLLTVLLVVVFVSAVLLFLNITEQQRMVVTSLASQGDLYISETERVMLTLADVYSHLSELEQNYLLTSAPQNFPRFSFFFFLNDQGVVESESSLQPLLIGLDLSGEDYFSRTKEIGRAYFSEPFVSLYTQEVVVTVTAAVYHEDEFQGVLVGELNLALLQQFIEDIGGLESGISFIVDQRGTFIAHPNQDLVQQRVLFYELPELKVGLDQDQVLTMYRSDQTNTWQVASMMEMAQDWMIVTTQSLRNMLGILVTIFIVASVAFAVSVVLFSMRMQASFDRITAPLSTLAENAGHMSLGQYDNLEEIPSGQYEEIEILEESFSHMAQAVQERDRDLEQRVSDRTAQLEISNKDLESFMYSVSHDLRAPLRAIAGFSQVLEEISTEKLDDESLHYLERIRTNAIRMDQLINGLLDLSRLGRQSLNLESVNLTDLAANVISQIEELDSDRKIKYIIGSAPPAIADPTMTEIMLANLFSNAVKFTRDQTTPIIEFGYENSNDRTVYFVRDNGVGFDMKFSDKLYQPFYRLHSEMGFDGTGIGLAIVERVMRSHDGEVWAESKEEQGATFYFTFPNVN